MGDLQQCPFQRRCQDDRPAYGAAGFSFLDEPFQEEGVRGFDPLNSWVLSVSCDFWTGCGLSNLGHFRCVLQG